MFKPTRGLMVRDWEQDVVYLVQFPYTHTIVTPSAFSLKLETWLRITGIKYRNVSNQLTYASSKGLLPFIELNGRQFADSSFIIEHLRSHFKLPIDSRLSTYERAQCRAFTTLIEESLLRCIQYDRSKDFGWLATENGFAPHVSGLKKFIFQKIGIKKLQSSMGKVVHAQGYGRHSQAELEDIAKRDLIALSTLLGDKPFLFGDYPTTIDATLFGILVQLTDPPLHSKVIKPMLEKTAPNLLAFVKRIKQRYWPDWDKLLETLAMNADQENIAHQK